MLGKVYLLVKVGLVEPPLRVAAVHQQPPLLRQEIGNHLLGEKNHLLGKKNHLLGEKIHLLE